MGLVQSSHRYQPVAGALVKGEPIADCENGRFTLTFHGDKDRRFEAIFDKATNRCTMSVNNDKTRRRCNYHGAKTEGPWKEEIDILRDDPDWAKKRIVKIFELDRIRIILLANKELIVIDPWDKPLDLRQEILACILENTEEYEASRK